MITENRRIIAIRAERGSTGKRAAENYRKLLTGNEEIGRDDRPALPTEDKATPAPRG